ncbi:phospholipase D-like domain-containing protein [Azoarcus sp. KH32C]|uniref:phospholipase D-like domain-containing protein n=1 Tax=Azoarcus sp. KH32C TaxID=748247 RepID=UPI00023866EA|nr:phospholipase D-like domain-containing protein [Azoarcus sp. KH32C]BAL23684.1 hypothetical protein AZKH_1362 [Azoarcus sp. KH32C]
MPLLTSANAPAIRTIKPKEVAPKPKGATAASGPLQANIELILNGTRDPDHAQSVLPLFEKAVRFVCVVAFARESGWTEVKDALEDALKQGVRAQVVVGLDFFQTEPPVLFSLHALSKRYPKHLHFFVSGKSRKRTMHPKAYVFHYEDRSSTLIIGSANLTAGGLCSNHELSLMAETACDTLANAISAEIEAQVASGEFEPATQQRLNEYRIQHQIRKLHHQAAEEYAEQDWQQHLGAQAPVSGSRGGPYLPTLQAWLIRMRADKSQEGFDAQQVVRKDSLTHSKTCLTALRTMKHASPASFLMRYEKLLAGGWHSGGLHRGKSFMADDAAEFKAGLVTLHNALRANPKLPAGPAYDLVKTALLKVKGAAMNVASEILHSSAPTRFAVMNKNSVRGMRMAGFTQYPEKPDLKKVDDALYAKFCKDAEKTRIALGLDSLSELDALFNYAYWR